MPPPIVKVFDAATRILIALGEVVKNLVVDPPEPTTIVIGTEVPVASKTSTCALPVAIP